MSGDPYLYPNSSVLRNKFGIRNSEDLDAVERRYSTARAALPIPAGNFDLSHLQAIHQHLLQDVYALDRNNVCVRCNEHLAGCHLCGTNEIVRVPSADARRNDFRLDQEFAQQERAIRNGAEARRC